jgi:hypothetical protein
VILQPRFPGLSTGLSRAELVERLRRFFRLQGKPSFQVSDQVQAVVQLQSLDDVAFAQEPQYWILVGDLAGVAANFGHIGVQTPLDTQLVVVVDQLLVGGNNAELYSVDIVEGGAAILALATDAAVTLRNRTESANNLGVVRAGLSRILDNANALVGTSIANVTCPANTQILIPVGYKLFGGEQLFVRNNTLNVPIRATMWGRAYR